VENTTARKGEDAEASRNREAAPIPEWETRAKLLLRVEMARRGMNFKALARQLEGLKIFESAAQVSRKINRGKFSAAYLLACLDALGVEKLCLIDTRDSAPPAKATAGAASKVGKP